MTRFSEHSEAQTANHTTNNSSQPNLSEYSMGSAPGRTASPYTTGSVNASPETQTSTAYTPRQTSTAANPTSTSTISNPTSTSTTSNPTETSSTSNPNTNGRGYSGMGNQNAQSQYYRQMEMNNLYAQEQAAAAASLYYNALTPQYYSNYPGYGDGSYLAGDPSLQTGYPTTPTYQTDLGYDTTQNLQPGPAFTGPLQDGAGNVQGSQYIVRDPGSAPIAGPPGVAPGTAPIVRDPGQAAGGNQADYSSRYAGTDRRSVQGQGHGQVADNQISNWCPDLTESSYDDGQTTSSAPTATGQGRDQRSGDQGHQGRPERAAGDSTSNGAGTWSQYDFAVYDHLKQQAQSLVGHSIQEYDKTIPVRLGCARAVSLLVNKGYGFPVTDQAIGNLEQTLRKDGFTEVAIKDMKPGDVICGYRKAGDYPHGAVYMGNGQIFDNDSNMGTMQIQSIAKYNKSDFKRFVILRRPATVPAVAADSSAVASQYTGSDQHAGRRSARRANQQAAADADIESAQSDT